LDERIYGAEKKAFIYYTLRLRENPVAEMQPKIY
jgi:hypothetical protein